VGSALRALAHPTLASEASTSATLSGARNEKPGDMGQHFYVLERGKLRWVRTIKSDGNFMKAVE